jgi:hypothetical protein
MFMKAATTLIAMSALVLVAGCNRGAGNNSANASKAPANAAASNNAASANAAADHGDDHGEEKDKPTLVLDSNGILAGGTEESRVAFGSNSADTIGRVTPLLGKLYDKDESKECGAGPMEFANWGKVVLMFMDGKFVGWEQREASDEPWIGTPGGVTIGTPRSELQTSFGAAPKVEKTSLGHEFNAAGFTGLLSSDKPDAKVTALWAGTNCIMR